LKNAVTEVANLEVVWLAGLAVSSPPAEVWIIFPFANIVKYKKVKKLKKVTNRMGEFAYSQKSGKKPKPQRRPLSMQQQWQPPAYKKVKN
jgi:hypothetical protein